MRPARSAAPSASRLLASVTLFLSAATSQVTGTVVATNGGILVPHLAPRATPLDVPQPPKAVLTPIPHHPTDPVPAGTGGLPQPQSPPTEPRSVSVLAAPGDLKTFVSTAVQPAGALRNIVGEPSAAIHRDTAFMTGNWWAGLSKDSGMTWTHIDPYTRFPAPDGGFCCDQYVTHVKSHDLTVWFLQYAYSSTTQMGRQRIAVSRSRDDLRNDDNWVWYDLLPGMFGVPQGFYLDFPHVAASNDHLYVATNAYPGGSVTGQFHLVVRLPLAELQAGGTVHFTYANHFALGSLGRYRFTDGANATMFFAAHMNSSLLRVYSWPDTSNTITWYDRPIAAWSSANYSCPGPDNRDWFGERVFNIEGAYRVPGEIGFLWGCGQTPPSRPNPYVRVERFDPTNGMASLGGHDVWGSRAFHYPSCAANARGHVGGTMAYGGNDIYPSIVVFAVDDFQSTWAPLDIKNVRQSSNGPGSDAWGHYFTTQLHPLEDNTWIGTGLTIQGGLTRSFMEPRYVWFGRERDEPAWVSVTVQAPGSGGAVPITVHQTDRLGVSDSTTPFTLSYAPHQGYALTAPLVHTSGGQDFVFDHWEVNGNPRAVDDRAIVVSNLGTASDLDKAYYVPLRSLSIRSDNPAAGTAITVGAPDVRGNQNGTTPFSRDYKDGLILVLSAPAVASGNPFRHWSVGGVAQTPGDRTATVAMTRNLTATAVYWNHVNGSFTRFGQGCAGQNGVLNQTTSGTPEINLGGLQDPPVYLLGNGLPGGLALLVLGFDRNQWSGIPLPLDLTPFGYPGCRLYTELVATFTRSIDFAGMARVVVSLPPDASLIGAHYYTQFWGIENLSLRFSNAVDTALGGNL